MLKYLEVSTELVGTCLGTLLSRFIFITLVYSTIFFYRQIHSATRSLKWTRVTRTMYLDDQCRSQCRLVHVWCAKPTRCMVVPSPPACSNLNLQLHLGWRCTCRAAAQRSILECPASVAPMQTEFKRYSPRISRQSFSLSFSFCTSSLPVPWLFQLHIRFRPSSKPVSLSWDVANRGCRLCSYSSSSCPEPSQCCFSST